MHEKLKLSTVGVAEKGIIRDFNNRPNSSEEDILVAIFVVYVSWRFILLSLQRLLRECHKMKRKTFDTKYFLWRISKSQPRSLPISKAGYNHEICTKNT